MAKPGRYIGQLSTLIGGTGGDAWSDAVDADIVPDGDGTRDLGTTAIRFAETYTDALDVTNNIVVGGTVDGRDIATDGTKLDGIESAATADQTAAEILTALLTVDGTGSGLDADLLDGNEATAFETADADILKADTADVLTAGFATTVDDDGTQSSGTYTPDESTGNFKNIVNGGAFTLGVPTNDTNIVVQVTNNATAGTITTSSYNAVTGDSLTTTNGDDFLLYITKINGFSHLNIVNVS